MATNSNLMLTASCPVCATTDGLKRCQGCKVVSYCSRKHQVEDRDAHKRTCNFIKKSQAKLETEEQRLRVFPPDLMSPANLFENSAGHFWGIVETRTYMRLRFGLVGEFLEVNTPDAVQAALGHLTDLLRLSRSDGMGVRDLVPAVYLRLGRDQESYDFVKWYATEGQRSDYDWGNIDQPFLDVKDADVFEGVGVFCGKYMDVSHAVAVTLIKLRLLQDVKALQRSTAVHGKVPTEIVDNIRARLVGTIVANRKDIMEQDDHSVLIKKLEAQLDRLYTAVHRDCPYFWPALVDPERHFQARPSCYSEGTPAHMEILLKFNYDSWAETPGAIDTIRDMSKKKGVI